ncbi:MAG: helix-turn-helix domain-containing protein [bacterium]|nr:helix-turn-helix domain-containing protein [bacterium]
MRKPKQLQKLVRGFSNHRRIEIMELLAKSPELSVTEISDMLIINYKTGADHIRRLALSGIVMKRNDNNSVRHALTDDGKSILKFLRTLE